MFCLICNCFSVESKIQILTLILKDSKSPFIHPHTTKIMDLREHQLIAKKVKQQDFIDFGTCNSLFPVLNTDFSLNRKGRIIIHNDLDIYILYINSCWMESENEVDCNTILSIYKNIRLICWTASRAALESSWIR